jgi:hypothetical protein
MAKLSGERCPEPKVEPSRQGSADLGELHIPKEEELLMESATSRAGGAGSEVDRPARRGDVRRLSTETKQAFKTTEFWAMVVVIVGILVAAASIKGGAT